MKERGANQTHRDVEIDSVPLSVIADRNWLHPNIGYINGAREEEENCQTTYQQAERHGYRYIQLPEKEKMNHDSVIEIKASLHCWSLANRHLGVNACRPKGSGYNLEEIWKPKHLMISTHPTASPCIRRGQFTVLLNIAEPPRFCWRSGRGYRWVGQQIHFLQHVP